MIQKINKQYIYQAQFLYLILAAIFIASLVTCNLIFQKFFSFNFFGLHTFEVSVGLLPYPITFLVTDLISEIYGPKRANQVVVSGLLASLFVLVVIMLANFTSAVSWSPINNAEFDKMFGFTILSVGSSMAAYLVAQFMDIRIFHFWKKKTQGKHLWLRNNFSTITSQFLDSLVVIGLLCLGSIIEWSLFIEIVFSSWLLKILFAVLDTPILYFLVSFFKKRFGLSNCEEIEF